MYSPLEYSHNISIQQFFTIGVVCLLKLVCTVTVECMYIRGSYAF